MGWQENFIPRPPLRQTRVHWCLWIHKCQFVGDSNQLRLLQECIFFFRWRTWRNAPSVSYWNYCFRGCSAFHLPTRDLLKKARTRNLPSGWSTEASKIPFHSYCTHHFWNLQIGTETKIWRWNQSGLPRHWRGGGIKHLEGKKHFGELPPACCRPGQRPPELLPQVLPVLLVCPINSFSFE